MKLVLLEAGYGRVFRFKYPRFKVDKRPRVLTLGKWRNPRTDNVLVCGINLNYLSDLEIEELRKGLGQILAQKNLKKRYAAGNRLLPGIFRNAYRTYRADSIVDVSRETLRKWPTAQAQDREAKRKKWKDMSPEERRSAYIERARKATATKAAKQAEAERAEAERAEIQEPVRDTDE